MINQLGIFLACATLVEGIVQYGKDIRQKPVLISTLIAGLIVAFIWNLQLFAHLGMAPQFPIADTIGTGMVISRGSNYLHMLVRKITGYYNETLPVDANISIESAPDLTEMQ